MRILGVVCFLAFFALISLAAVPTRNETGDSRQELLQVSVEVADTKPGAVVGAPMRLKVILRNTTQKPLLVQDWEKSPHVIILALATKDIPGQSVGSWGPIGFSKPLVLPVARRPVPPGDTIAERSITPMIPGHLRIAVQVWCPAGPPDETSGEKAIWQGRARAALEIRIPADMPEDMKTRYADYQKRLNDSGLPLSDKMEILAKVAAEKHYFAARFIREACDTLSVGSLKDSAIEHLAKLARFGTAYESFPFLLNALSDDKTPVEARRVLLDWIAQVAEAGWYQRLGEQVSYSYPEPLRKQGLDALNRVSTGRDPYLAAKAADILKRLSEKKEM